MFFSRSWVRYLMRFHHCSLCQMSDSKYDDLYRWKVENISIVENYFFVVFHEMHSRYLIRCSLKVRSFCYKTEINSKFSWFSEVLILAINQWPLYILKSICEIKFIVCSEIRFSLSSFLLNVLSLVMILVLLLF